MSELESLSLFRGVPRSALTELSEQGTRVHFEHGTVVFKQGTQADHALLVLDGRLKAWAEEGARSQPVSDVFPGELVGEAALFGRHSVRTVTLKAWAPTETLRLTAADLDALSGSPAVAALQRHMLQTLARRLRTTNHAARRLWSKRPSIEVRTNEVTPVPIKGEGPSGQIDPVAAEGPQSAHSGGLWARVGQLLGRLA